MAESNKDTKPHKMHQFVSKFHLGKFELTYHNQAISSQEAAIAAKDSSAMFGWHYDGTQLVTGH